MIDPSDLSEDKQNWIIGRLTNTTVKHENGVDTPITKTSSFTYDETTGMLKSETIENSIIKSYIYDNFGNKTKEKIEATGVPTTITSYIYEGYDSRFLTTITNVLGHTEKRTYTPKGEVASITDANGQTISFIVTTHPLQKQNKHHKNLQNSSNKSCILSLYNGGFSYNYLS